MTEKSNLEDFVLEMLKDEDFLRGSRTVHLPVWNIKTSLTINTFSQEENKNSWYSGFVFAADPNTNTIKVGANSEFCYVMGKIQALADILDLTNAHQTSAALRGSIKGIKKVFLQLFSEKIPEIFNVKPHYFDEDCLNGSFDLSIEINEKTAEILFLFIGFSLAHLSTLSDYYDKAIESLGTKDLDDSEETVH
jgi:hypothetical protein